MTAIKQCRPGDIILDRYMPDATTEQREEARANLKTYAAVFMRINQRLARDAGDKEARAIADRNVESEL